MFFSSGIKPWFRVLSIAFIGKRPMPYLKNEWSFPMPKMKTKSSAKKRFKVLGNGGVKRGHAFKSHILTKKTTKTKRQLRGTAMVNERDMASIAKMLPYA